MEDPIIAASLLLLWSVM